jgi:hypothetical protein
VAVAAVAAGVALAVVGPASAATLNGVATIDTPNGLASLGSGASTTPFTVALPANAGCSGDTASNGYHVYSYLVPQGTSVAGATFVEYPSTGYGFVDNTGLYYGPANTAIGTGQIISIPNDLQWAPLVTADSVPLGTLLYTSGTSGVWEAGLVCANTHGAVTDNWNTEVTFTANAGDPHGFTWAAMPGEPAAITSSPSTTFTEGTAGSFAVTTLGAPTPTVTESGSLPAGVTFAAGVLSGTPTQDGTYLLTFTAHNGVGSDAVQSFTLTVDSAPAFSSAAGTTFSEGISGSFSVTATGTPAPTVTESGDLPNGVSFAGGVLSGTPTQDGSYPVTFTAHNGAGSDAVQSFTLDVVAGPSISSAAGTTFTEGAPGTFTVTAVGNPSPTITESGDLPNGVSFAGGVLSGTPTQDGTYPLTFTAHNGVGSDAVQSFTLTVDSAPAVTSAPGTTFTEGTAGSFSVTATGNPSPTVAESGSLPAGVTFAGGVLSGTPSQGGTYAVTFTAHNGVGSDAVQSFTLTVDSPPAITSAGATTFYVGNPGTFTVTASGTPAPVIYVAGALPSGVTFANGVLSGTPSVAGTYPILLAALNGIGNVATQTFTLTVQGLTVSTPSLPPGIRGTPYSATFAVVGGKAPYKWKSTAKLPKGLTLSSAGVLSGTVSTTKVAAGSYAISVSVSDSGKKGAKETASATLTLVLS